MFAQFNIEVTMTRDHHQQFFFNISKIYDMASYSVH